MSNQLAIATVTASIERILDSPLGAEIGGAIAVSDRPRDGAADFDADPGITVFLYGVSPTTAYTPFGEDLPTRRNDGSLIQRPRAALELSYILIAYGDPSRHEPERLLGVALRELHAHPIIDRDLIASVRDAANPPPPDAPLHPHLAATDLDDEIELVKLSPRPLDVDETSKLWSSLQVPYALSMAYRASVVFIEADTPGEPSLPVLERAVYAVPLRRPVIERVESTTGTDQPIFATDTIVVSGSNLRGDTTLVRLSGADLLAAAVTNTRVSLPLPSAPAGSLRPGLQTVRIVQQLMMGDPATPHKGVTSNEATFSLHPTLANAATANVVPSGADRSGDAVVDVDLIVDADQPVVLRLSDLATEAIEYRVGAPERTASGTTLTVPFEDVAVGTYLVQVEISGADSQVERDATLAATGPTLVIA